MGLLHRFHNDLTMDSSPSDIPLPDYPRPQLVRDSYLPLNGRWEDGALVPYPLESSYNNINRTEYTYYRHFSLPEGFMKDRLILHFGAVDQIADVYVDGQPAIHHEGGYLPFECDITDLLSNSTEHELKVTIQDTLSHLYPYGKQKKHPGGMWYTPVSGIWQSIWLESVPINYIEAVEITPSLDSVSVLIYSEADRFDVAVSYKGDPVCSVSSDTPDILINIDNPRLWTPDEPNLYDITIRTGNDEVSSYFGLRTVSIEKVNDIPRILLNGEPFFFHGVLDQGYFPQGLFTPNSEKDYERDILNLKSLGFNTIRKHIKIEPACFYEACDRLGMIVFQDMVNNGRYSFLRDTVIPTFISQQSNDTRRRVKDEVKYMFEQHMEGTLVHLYNFPSIVYYTIFNEGWGQFDSDTMINICHAMDPSRVFDSTSGWFKQEDSDVESIHKYFGEYRFIPSDRPVILSEFGGFSLKVKDHIYARFSNYGYGTAKDSEALTRMIEDLYNTQIIPAISAGLCGSIYTQITDIEEETNGLYTYDRKVCKVIPERMRALSEHMKITK